jgi:hypothetical protein
VTIPVETKAKPTLDDDWISMMASPNFSSLCNFIVTHRYPKIIKVCPVEFDLIHQCIPPNIRYGSPGRVDISVRGYITQIHMVPSPEQSDRVECIDLSKV